MTPLDTLIARVIHDEGELAMARSSRQSGVPRLVLRSIPAIANQIALPTMTGVSLLPNVLWRQFVATKTLRPFWTTSNRPRREFPHRLVEREAFTTDQTVKPFVIEISSSSELDQRHAFVAVVHQHVVAPRLALPFRRRPSTIARLVISVWIDSVKRATVRTFAHVRQEGREVVTPFLTHLDTSSSPITKTNRVRVVASFLGFTP